MGRLIFEKGQGTLSVKTDPAGAVVSLDGQTLASPAIFNKVLAGTKTVQVKLEGTTRCNSPLKSRATVSPTSASSA